MRQELSVWDGEVGWWLATLTTVKVQLLWVNLVTDRLPTTTLPLHLNKQDSDVMKAKPRKVSEAVVTGWLFFRYLVIGASRPLTIGGCGMAFHCSYLYHSLISATGIRYNFRFRRFEALPKKELRDK
ncbi:hypothetical protein V6N13_011996 [Hibiscus sabdariffa]